MILITYEIATGNVHSVTALKETGKLADWRAGRIPWSEVRKDFGAPPGMALEIIGGEDRSVIPVAADGAIPAEYSPAKVNPSTGRCRWDKDAKRMEAREETQEEREARKALEAKRAAREALKAGAKNGTLSAKEMQDAIRLLLED